MEVEASHAAFVYDALPGLTLAFSLEEPLDDVAEDATATYAVFRNEITAAGDVLANIPASDFFSLDLCAPVEAEPASPAATPPSSSLAPAEQPAQGSERAWFRGGRRFRSPMLQRSLTSTILSHLLLKSNLHGQLLCMLSPMLSNIYGLGARWKYLDLSVQGSIYQQVISML